jgi:hypothetical protein
MKAKPSIETFIHGGAADKVARGEIDGQERREQKAFRLSISIIEAIKTHAFNLSAKEQRRVSELEVLEMCVRKQLKI